MRNDLLLDDSGETGFVLENWALKMHFLRNTDTIFLRLSQVILYALMIRRL
jgi:hypothetical protein